MAYYNLCSISAASVAGDVVFEPEGLAMQQMDALEPAIAADRWPSVSAGCPSWHTSSCPSCPAWQLTWQLLGQLLPPLHPVAAEQLHQHEQRLRPTPADLQPDASQ